MADRRSTEQLADEILGVHNRFDDPRRLLIGIAGPPGAGKSTLTARLIGAINRRAGERLAEMAPMDGFHLPNRELDRQGLRPYKGQPQTFEAVRFVSALEVLKAVPRVAFPWPDYDRGRHDPIPGAIRFEKGTRIVITEGNYLLLDIEPWRRVRRLLDVVWYVHDDQELLIERLLRRYLEGGRTQADALNKINSSDLSNLHLVADSRTRADLWLRPAGPDHYDVSDAPF